jgi:hypothetical protein
MLLRPALADDDLCQNKESERDNYMYQIRLTAVLTKMLLRCKHTNSDRILKNRSQRGNSLHNQSLNGNAMRTRSMRKRIFDRGFSIEIMSLIERKVLQ